MASLQSSSSLIYSSSSSSSSTCCSSSSRRINAAIHLPNLKKVRFSIPKLPTKNLADELSIIDSRFVTTTFPAQDHQKVVVTTRPTNTESSTTNNSASSTDAELYMILEAVADRVEMHKNICEQRNNWNTLLLNSVNMITLTAATMSGVAVATSTGDAGTTSILALKLSSTLLFSAATGILAVMNKIQPSQLVEEQRCATRLFSQLQSEIKTILALRSPTTTTQKDVKVMMGKVLALDKAYPLPLIGTMLEKLPQTFEPSCWWPKNDHRHFQEETNVSSSSSSHHEEEKNNGWSESLEREMREILQVIKTKDMEDYERLGNIALKVNKVLAISGPLLTGIAAVAASPFVGSSSSTNSIIGSCAAIISVVAGSLACVVNTFEHGGQVGMVFEMYRNCAGFFQLLEDSIESTLDEPQVEKRENGEMFEMKVALKLGRSLSQLRDLAKNSENSRIDGRSTIDEFASKLF